MSVAPRPAAAPERAWWRGAVVYQIYPWSFADANGDGIGDLAGITAHLDHVASLGVDAVWISPFYTSPMRDFGYDIADYRDVDPRFGTIADFDALVGRAHALGLRVVVDQVYSHSSDQHPWFVESRTDRTNARADWYVWADAKADGSPPSNWQSVFGGPAWTWDARRRQYYLHNFLTHQPDLNVHNPHVQQALLDVARFWLDRGVDGFRLDAINFAMHDPALTDNPPAPDDGRARTRPFDFQLRRHNQSHPDIAAFLERIRALCDGYGDRFLVAEVGGDEALAEMHAFTLPGRLNSAYGFDYLYADRITPALVAETIARWPETVGWPSWAFSNHDAPRAVSRWADEGDRARSARLFLLLLTALRGNIFLYQGEELGLPQAELPFEALRDPEAIANWPLTLGRDGARTPMPWRAAAENAGFGSGTPWLPVPADHVALAVDAQEDDPDSTLNLTRRLVRLRAAAPALLDGAIEIMEAGEALLTFRRGDGAGAYLCAINLSDRALDWRLPAGWTIVEGVNGAGDDALPAWAGLIARRSA